MLQRWVTVTMVALVGLATASATEKRQARPSECCVLPRGLAPSTMRSAFKKCIDKYPNAKSPLTTSQLTPTSPLTQEVKNARACVAECVFSEEGLLTADKEVNKTAVISYFSRSVTDAEVDAARTATLDTCLPSYKADVDPGLECHSGADELHKCVNREVFLHCPRSMWSSTPECEDLKTKVTVNKDIPVFFRGPKRGTKDLAPKVV